MSLEFTGSVNEIVTTGYTTNHAAASICFWVIVDADTTSNQRFVAKRTSGSSFVWSVRWADSTNTFQLQYGHATTDGVWRGNTALSFGVVYHVTITYDNSSTANDPVIYIDGVADAITEQFTPAGAADTPAAAFTIGNDSGNSNALDGMIADVRHYSRILTAAEVQTIYASRGSDGIVNGLVFRFPLNELAPGTASTAANSIKDRSATQGTASPTASPTYRADIGGTTFARAA